MNENPAPGKPRIVRVVSDDTLDAWEKQRAEYLAQHPADASKPIRDELVREALGLPEEKEDKEKKEETPREKKPVLVEMKFGEEETEEEEEKKKEEKTEEKTGEKEEVKTGEEEKTEVEEAEKAQREDEENEDEKDAEEELEEEAEDAEEEEKENEKQDEEETESLVEVEPGEARAREEAGAEAGNAEAAGAQKRRPRITRVIDVKPALPEKLEEQALRDLTPTKVEPGTPLTIGDASKEMRADEARRLWAQREESKRAKLGFFGKIKAALGFR